MSSMMDSLSHDLAKINREELAIGAGLFVFSVVGSLAVVTIVLCRLPADYLQRPEGDSLLEGRPLWQRVLITIGKNLLGVILVAVGVVLSLPGVPGQGLLTILIGLMLLDFPGKRNLEHRLISRPSIFNSINKLRDRFHRPPLLPAAS